MIIDKENEYADGQALTASGASTNIIDHGAVNDLGHGEPLGVLVTVDVAADGTTTDETYQFALQADNDSAFGSATTVWSKSIGYATLVAGYQFVIPIGQGDITEQYSRLYLTLGGTTPSITYTAQLLPLKHIDRVVAYADAL